MLAAEAVIVARENYRVQDTRYRAGAVTILDLLDGQVDLADAEAGLVQARYATRLRWPGSRRFSAADSSPVRAPSDPTPDPVPAR